jgi:WD40 repeat protein
MEQGLKLLMQLVLEFAPVMVNFIQKRTEKSLHTTNSLLPQIAEDFLQTVNIVHQANSSKAEFVEKENLQQQVTIYNNQTQLKIAQQAKETALDLPEIHKILDSWPLRLYPTQILESHTSDARKRLKIFVAPPQVNFDKFDHKSEKFTDIELILAEGLREFINQHYSLHHPERPTEFLAGAWDSKRFHSESSVKALFSALKTEPVLILESEADGDYLNFRIAYWGLGQVNYFYKTISRLPYREILQDSAKSRALAWRKIRNELINLGEDIAEIDKLGKDNAMNLAILEKAEKWQAKGIDVSQLDLEYQINHQDLANLGQVLITCHSLVAAWVADAYHLVHHDVSPLLPELLPDLLQDKLDLQSVQAIVSGYKQVYQALQNERSFWVPELALQLAQSLSHLPDVFWSQEQVYYSINTWLQLRQVSTQEVRHPLEAMQLAISVEDEKYVTKLSEYFAAVGDHENLVYVEKLLAAIAHLKTKQYLATTNSRYTLSGHSGKVTSIVITPDSEMLVSGCADKNINVWSLHTGKLIRTFTGNSEAISSVAVSPDGKFLGVGSCEHPQGNVKVWNLQTGKLVHTLLGHQKPVNLVAISPDGQILASGSNKIKIWNLHTGNRICTLWHTEAVQSAIISPNGNILASGSSDSKIRLWNPYTGDPLSTFIGHRSKVTSLVISPNGEILYSGSADKTIKIWHLTTGKLLNTLTGHTEEVKSLAISPDGKTLWSGSADQTIKKWHLATGEVLQTLTGHSGTVNAVAVSQDGKLLASGSADKTIKIWQVV